MATINEVHARLMEVHSVVTERVGDSVAAPDGLDLASALTRVLRILRRVEQQGLAREQVIMAALTALTASLGETGTAVLAKVDEALAAVAELDDDLPEGPEVPPTPVA